MPAGHLSPERKAKMLEGRERARELKRKREEQLRRNLEHTPTHKKSKLPELAASSETNPAVEVGVVNDENQEALAEGSDDEDFGAVGLELVDDQGETGDAEEELGLNPQASSSPRAAVEHAPAPDVPPASTDMPEEIAQRVDVPAEIAQVVEAPVPSPTENNAAAPKSNLGVVEEPVAAAAEPMREPSPVPVSSSSSWLAINATTSEPVPANAASNLPLDDDVFGVDDFPEIDEAALYDDEDEEPAKTVLPPISSLLPTNFTSLTPATTVQHQQPPPPPPFPLAVPSLNASLDKVHLPPPGASYVHAGLSPSPSRSVLTSANASPLKSPAARRSDFVPYPIEFQYEYLEQGVIHRKQFTHLVVPVAQHHVIDHTWPARQQPSVPLLRQAPIKPFDESQMTTLISHAGGIDAPVPCDRCANDVGKIVKCRLQPYWLDGCMSCRFNSQTNKCSLRDQSKAVKRPGRQKRPQPGDEARLAELVAEIKGFRVLRFDEDFFRDMDADTAEDMVKEAAVVTEFARISSRLLKKSKGVDKALGRGRKGGDKSSK